MAGILLGDEECTYGEIVKIFDIPTISHLKLDWKLLAVRLGVDPYNIQEIENKKQKSSLCILDVLIGWRNKNSEKSTLKSFLNSISDNDNWSQLRVYIRNVIWDKAETWDDLDDVLQEGILQSKVRFLGLEYTLSSLGVIPDGKMLKSYLPQKPFVDILKCDEFKFPIPLPYYINRKLTIKRKLKPKIFREKCEDIFVFEGIERYELSLLEKAATSSGQQEPTDESYIQVRRKKLTVRFIRLFQQNDFSKIIAKRNTHPVHRIKYNAIDKTYTWVNTTGSTSLITKFLSDSCEEITDADFITNTLSVFNPRPVAICSGVGMGKSFLLKHLANQMKQHFPDRFIIFLELQKLIERFEKTTEEINTDFVIDALAKESTSHVLGRAILKQKLKDENTKFEIFFDGFDEISSKFHEKAKEVLNLLLVKTNIRCYITSRPHMTTELERTVEVVSYNIAPFTSEDQKKFFCAKWKHSFNNIADEFLIKFASKLLKSPSLQIGLEKVYGELAGIPLHCYMLAQVYSEHLVNFCEHKDIDDDIFSCTFTLFELYTTFMEHKFGKINNVEKEFVKKFHWLKAMQYLFPTSPLGITQSIENSLQKAPVFNETIFRVGILEASRDLNNPVFLHRTFAEFLVADFITEQLLKQQADLTDDWKTFIYDTILEKQTTAHQDFCPENTETYVNILKHSSFWKNNMIDDKDLETLSKEMFQGKSPPGSGYILKFDFLKLRFEDLSTDLNHTQQLPYMVKQFDKLLVVLNNLGWFQIADELERAAAYELQNCVFLHSTVCFFLDALLVDCNNVILTNQAVPFTVYRGLFSNLDSFSKTFSLKLLTCVTGCFGNLMRLVLKLCKETPYVKQNNVLQVDYECCQEIIFRGAYHDDREFFKDCCEMVNVLASVELKDARYNRFIQTKKYEHRPLHVAVKRGNYHVTEYLVNLNQINDTVRHNIWQFCLQGSYKDTKHVIKQKVQILYLLKSWIRRVDFDIIINHNFPFEVNSNLFTILCDIEKYIPSADDIVTIVKHVIKFDNGSQIDYFVDWLHKRKMGKMLTHNVTFWLLGVAQKYEKVQFETFRKIFALMDFDPRSILWREVLLECECECEAMIKIILQLTREVNHVDKEDRSLLHFAVAYRNFTAVKLLLTKGASVHLKDNDGNTPLHLAVLQHYPSREIVKLLLKYSLDISEKNDKGETPLSLVLQDRVDWTIEDCILQMFREKIMHNFLIVLALA